MTLAIILIVALMLSNGLWAFWQHRRLASLEATCATRATVALFIKALTAKVVAAEAKVAVAEAATEALAKTLDVRFKEYTRSDRFAKLENSLDTRIADQLKTVVENPAEPVHRACMHCKRVVARYEWFPSSQTAICANCNYKPEFK